MKDFSHADQNEMSAVDLNRAIASTLVVARSEYATWPTWKPNSAKFRA